MKISIYSNNNIFESTHAMFFTQANDIKKKILHSNYTFQNMINQKGQFKIVNLQYIKG